MKGGFCSDFCTFYLFLYIFYITTFFCLFGLLLLLLLGDVFYEGSFFIQQFHGKFHCLSSRIVVVVVFLYFIILLFLILCFMFYTYIFFMLFYMNAIFHCKKLRKYTFVGFVSFAYVFVCCVCICRDITFKKHKINIQPIQSQSVKNLFCFRVFFSI